MSIEENREPNGEPESAEPKACVSKGFSLQLGPRHPMFFEAENLVLKVCGGSVTDVQINLGYLHRGIEELMQRRDYMKNVFLSERVCGICSGVHTMNYCRAVEHLLGIDVPKRAEYVRVIVAELERIHSHLLWLGIAGYELGENALFVEAWKDREMAMELLEDLSGNRVNYGMNTIGGVRRNVPSSLLPKIRKYMAKISERSDHYVKHISSNGAVLKRISGLAVLSKNDVRKCCASGPICRASGVAHDVRSSVPYSAYNELDWSIVTEEEGDFAAKIMVRLRELKESACLVLECAEKMKSMPSGQLAASLPAGVLSGGVGLKVPEGEAVRISEAPRGELFYYLKSDGSEIPARVRIRTPSIPNVLSLKTMLRGAALPDVPLIVASIDPCFSCTDRVAVIDEKSGARKTFSEQDFRAAFPSKTSS